MSCDKVGSRHLKLAVLQILLQKFVATGILLPQLERLDDAALRQVGLQTVFVILF